MIIAYLLIAAGAFSLGHYGPHLTFRREVGRVEYRRQMKRLMASGLDCDTTRRQALMDARGA
jgi:hypothetical protein